MMTEAFRRCSLTSEVIFSHTSFPGREEQNILSFGILVPTRKSFIISATADSVVLCEIKISSLTTLYPYQFLSFPSLSVVCINLTYSKNSLSKYSFTLLLFLRSNRSYFSGFLNIFIAPGYPIIEATDGRSHSALSSFLCF